MIKRLKFMRRLLLLLVFLGLAPWALAQPAQIILIRHAEKPADPNAAHLSEEGQKRAKKLVPFLTTTPSLTNSGLPVALYATRATKRGRSLRTEETITPLAEELHLPIQTPYLAENYAALARSILRNRNYQGKTVLICWIHEYLPQLAAALGVKPPPPKWKSEVFNRLYLISYQDGKATLQDLPQVLVAKKAKKKKH